MEESKYTKLWELQSEIEESLYECGGMNYEETQENAQIEIELAYACNEITKEQCKELLKAMGLELDIRWMELDEERAENNKIHN